jgi:hypothetical protein
VSLLELIVVQVWDLQLALLLQVAILRLKNRDLRELVIAFVA